MPLTLNVPVFAAPMAGGPTTPALVAAVSGAGGLGILAAGYRRASDVAGEIAAVRALTDRPFGVNLFLPGPPGQDPAAVQRYAAELADDAAALGVELGLPRWDDDEVDAKLALVAGVAVVTTTFGCPSAETVARLQASGSVVLATVTSAAEAAAAVDSGVNGLCLQGNEAGAHRGSFVDDDAPGLALLELLSAVRAVCDVPLVATGGLMDGADIARVLAAGATAAMLGTAFLGCPEAGTSATHLAALHDPRFTETATTRAFTGRTARGLVNAFLREHSDTAPWAYPEVNHLTRPLRTAAAAQGDADRLHLWAGTGWQRLRRLPAAELVAALSLELAQAC